MLQPSAGLQKAAALLSWNLAPHASALAYACQECLQEACVHTCAWMLHEHTALCATQLYPSSGWHMPVASHGTLHSYGNDLRHLPSFPILGQVADMRPGCRIRAPVLPRARRLDEGAAAAAVARADAKQAAQDLQERMHSWRSEAEAEQDAAEVPDEPEADPEAVAELVEAEDDEDDQVYGGIFEGRCSRRGSGLSKPASMPHSGSRPMSAQRRGSH